VDHVEHECEHPETVVYPDEGYKFYDDNCYQTGGKFPDNFAGNYCRDCHTQLEEEQAKGRHDNWRELLQVLPGWNEFVKQGE
jgi:hypothetical protein